MFDLSHLEDLVTLSTCIPDCFSEFVSESVFQSTIARDRGPDLCLPWT